MTPIIAISIYFGALALLFIASFLADINSDLKDTQMTLTELTSILVADHDKLVQVHAKVDALVAAVHGSQNVPQDVVDAVTALSNEIDATDTAASA